MEGSRFPVNYNIMIEGVFRKNAGRRSNSVVLSSIRHKRDR